MALQYKEKQAEMGPAREVLIRNVLKLSHISKLQIKLKNIIKIKAVQRL